MPRSSLAWSCLSLVFSLVGVIPHAHAQRAVHVLGPEKMEIRHGTYEEVTRAVREDMRLDVLGRPSAKGPAFEAAYQKLVLGTASARARTLREGSYDTGDVSHRVRISGVPNGLLRAMHLGTASAHDLGGNVAAIKARAEGDLIRISFAHGQGPERVLVDRGKGGQVSENELEIPLAAPGVPTFLIYERLDPRGRVVGGRNGYRSGRILELHWDGTTGP